MSELPEALTRRLLSRLKVAALVGGDGVFFFAGATLGLPMLLSALSFFFFFLSFFFLS